MDPKAKDEVALLTEAAMSGSLPIDAVYAERLSIVRPSREAVAWLGERYVQELVPGAMETVGALRSLGKDVYVLSGGLLPAVRQLAGEQGRDPVPPQGASHRRARTGPRQQLVVFP